jgi:hypothetical protein
MSVERNEEEKKGRNGKKKKKVSPPAKERLFRCFEGCFSFDYERVDCGSLRSVGLINSVVDRLMASMLETTFGPDDSLHPKSRIMGRISEHIHLHYSLKYKSMMFTKCQEGLLGIQAPLNIDIQIWDEKRNRSRWDLVQLKISHF